MKERNDRLFTDGSNWKYTFTWMAAFTLGSPPILSRIKNAKTPGIASWDEMRNLLADSLSTIPGISVAEEQVWTSNVNMPFGQPCEFHFDNFFDVISFREDLLKLGFAEEYFKHIEFSDQVWICPSGIVLLYWRISTDVGSIYTVLDRIIGKSVNISNDSGCYCVEPRYPELSAVFLEITRIIQKFIEADGSFLPRGTLANTLDRTLRKTEQLLKPSDELWIRAKQIVEYSQNDLELNMALNDLLLDVYDIGVRPLGTDGESLEISYTEARLASDDECYEFTLAVAYHAFPTFLWLKNHLNGELTSLQAELSLSTQKKGQLRRLRSLMIFCERLISGSQPISIRITRIYMEHLEKFFKEERLELLSDLVRNQLVTLEKVIDSLDAIHVENRNFKIGVAAMVLSIISISSVVAQLISTLDLTGGLQFAPRLQAILLGTVIGAFATISVFIIPKFFKRS